MNMFICICKSVTDHQIRDAVDIGVSSFKAMQSHLAVSTVCGGCACEVKRVISQKLESELGSRAAIGTLQVEQRV
ncbi:MAG: bacterioferritin-associated ferredoxin [Arenicella sp.]|jgi:bacterioferritin-associated ferredoxin